MKRVFFLSNQGNAMQDSLTMVREAAKAVGLELPVEREQSIAHAYETALKQAEAIRIAPTPVPTPDSFDAAWSEKK
jgi:hypothetical protein